MSSQSADGPDAVKLKGVGKTFRGQGGAITALDDVILDLSLGECVTIMGPSGSGKTTLLGVIGGVVEPDEGSVVEVCGKRWSDLSEREQAAHRRRSIGFIHQSYNLVEFMSVRENVLLPLLMNGDRPGDAAGRADTALERLGLVGLGERRPRELSGGQQQRAAIARAMAAAQPVLLADEPTGALDSATSRLVFEAIRGHAASGGLAVLVSHNPMAADYADRTVTLLDGRLR